MIFVCCDANCHCRAGGNEGSGDYKGLRSPVRLAQGCFERSRGADRSVAFEPSHPEYINSRWQPQDCNDARGVSDVGL